MSVMRDEGAGSSRTPTYAQISNSMRQRLGQVDKGTIIVAEADSPTGPGTATSLNGYPKTSDSKYLEELWLDNVRCEMGSGVKLTHLS